MIELQLTAWGTTSLGELIEILKRLPKDRSVQFDFCYLRPTTVHSYRGYYEHLAIGWSSEPVSPGRYWPNVAEVLSVLEDAVGETFEGHKGGDYTMSSSTPVWVANPRDTGGTGVVAVEDGASIILHTRKVD